MKRSTILAVPLSLRKKSFIGSKTTLVLPMPVLLLSTGAIVQAEDPIMLDAMRIEERTLDSNPYAEKGAPYKARIAGDSRHVKSLAETPQTISVLTHIEIEEPGDTDFRDLLAARPCITLGTGENGNAFGGRYVNRGHKALLCVIDGLRDPGMTSRESFAADQIEISIGPSSTFAGCVSMDGAVNSIAEQASSEYEFTKVTAGVFTDSFQRYNLDANQRINSDVDSDHSAETISLSFVDTVDTTDSFSVFAGVRAHYFDYSNKVAVRNSDDVNNWAYSDTLWNGHVGAVYELTDNGNVYATFSAASNTNGGESDVGGSCRYGGLWGDVSIVEDSEPENTQNFELGAKWDLLDEQLLATAAVFQITKSNVMEVSGVLIMRLMVSLTVVRMR